MSRSVMSHNFSRIPKANIPRSSFDRSHGLKTTFDAGQLIPIFVDEALPGDTMNVSLSAFCRLATPIHPTMDNLFMETFFFAVPNRLVWDNWHRFMGAQDNPGDHTDYVVPKLEPFSHPEKDLSDYFGIPTEISVAPNCLHHRAYSLIWNEWFRHQDLQDSIPIDTDDGPDQFADHEIQYRNKAHDYFTSCLPWPQKGPQVTLPLGTQAPIKGIGYNGQSYVSNTTNFYESGGTTATYDFINHFGDDPTSWVGAGTAETGGYPDIYADLSNAAASSVNELRQAFQIQKLQERDARGGTRLTEIIRAHFGVISDDARMQRPEFLGGGSTRININPVAQTSETDVGGAPGDNTPQGNLAAFGTASLNGHGFTKSFTEHCLLIGLVNVRADLTYQQGMERMWTRDTKHDFYWPALSHIGEQAVRLDEIYCTGDPVDDVDTFGYNERYSEYRYKPSRITGMFRSASSAPLDPWHYSIDFQSRPALNENFMRDDPPIDRTIAVPEEEHFLFDGYFKYRCARPMPTYGTPGMIDHF